ncbi:amidohydrolase family protein [Thalassotalea sp. PS06]|uniref:amidohydrolase family protein n=1 Tax=Thalassotalea sp. PS06 TaxID=2594005 RepID=UPI0011633C6B|nr:amidohydrolase family protein [Thalassotalea sp. PS06]QDP02361.1 amidohydrolase family protein [Thalassotalea sp. PS06]
MKIIDPHLHFFDFEGGEYGWLKSDDAPHWPNKQQLRRSYLFQDIKVGKSIEVAGLVHIEAGYDNKNPEKELAFLDTQPLANFKSIACADLTKPDFEKSLTKLENFKHFIGVRHIIDDQGANLLFDSTFEKNLALLAERELIFEAQLDCCDSESAKRLAQLGHKYSQLQICINHCGILRDYSSWPAIPEYAHWRASMHYFSDEENFALKISGMEMQNPRWNWNHARWLVHKLGNLYSEDRLMFASNFPINLLSMPYDALWLGYRDELGLSDASFQALSHDNAKRIYRL